MFNDNLILLTDGYKFSHSVMFPPKTQHIYSYFESRGGEYSHVLFFGLQYILKQLERGISMENIDEAEEIVNSYFGKPLFDRTGWERIVRKHQGRIPLIIKAVEEGTLVNNKNVLITVENTDPELFWLTNFFESLMVQVWYPSTVATQSFFIKQRILDYLEATGTPEEIDYKLHDFGFRGVSSVESAAIGGLAHLVNFKGSDTLIAVQAARKFYHHKGTPCSSVPASEHSTITSWGMAHELDAYKNVLEQYPTGIVACVTDSYCHKLAVTSLFGNALHKEVLARDGILVVRPDSGNPRDVVLDTVEYLDKAFGSLVNSKGFKVLNPKVRVLQGDGINYQSIESILHLLTSRGYSADNVSFGMGGALLQGVNRDTQKFAFKCSSAVVDGIPREVFKDPSGDPGKTSKRGRLGLQKATDGSYITTNWEGDSELGLVFSNGHVVKEVSLDIVRENADQYRKPKALLGRQKEWQDKGL